MARTTSITHVLVAETLSVYPEYIAYGNSATTLLKPRGQDTHLFWMSKLHFSCPVPTSSQTAVATVLSNGTPTLYVNVVPIWTSVW